MSYGATVLSTNKLCEDYDMEAQYWVDDLKQRQLVCWSVHVGNRCPVVWYPGSIELKMKW